MQGPEPTVVCGAVEGSLDEAVLQRLIREAGAAPGPIHGKNGKERLSQQLSAYNQAAAISPWLVLVDLDNDAECAPPFCARCLTQPAPLMCFRVVVREIETWLLADRDPLARFIGVAAARVLPDAETVPDPKELVVALAKDSRYRQVREDLVPRPGSGRRVGPLYTARMIEFVERHWRPEAAVQGSDSLRRCRQRLKELVDRSR